MSLVGEFSETDITVDLEGFVATVEIHRPPHNYFNLEMVTAIADAYEFLAMETDCRAIVLVSEGKSFCAGAEFGKSRDEPEEEVSPGTTRGRSHIYEQGARMMQGEIPVVAAIQGAAIGGGLGVALTSDFRVAAPEARFSANFARLGFHHGFGLTVTLPELVGNQAAMNLLLTGRRVKADEALVLGLCDEVVEQAELRERARSLANEIALSAPLSIRAIRRTMRQGLVDRFRAATDREQVEQEWLRKTMDFGEGIRATAARRDPEFQGI
jgi:enoyl-CoA hydratase/carnithine racemase